MTIAMVIQALILMFGAVLHGITGMAFPMIGTVVLSFALPISTAVAILALPSLLISFLVILSRPEAGSIGQEILFYFRKYFLLFLGCAIGTYLGVKLLFILPLAYLYLLLAAVTFYYAIHGFLSNQNWVKAFKVTPNLLNSGVFGFLAGLIGGATNAMSPILLIYLFSASDNKNEISKAGNYCSIFAKSLQIYFLQDYIAQFKESEFYLLAAISLGSLLFLWFGILIRQRIDQHLFKNSVYLILFFLAAKTLYSGVLAF